MNIPCPPLKLWAGSLNLLLFGFLLSACSGSADKNAPDRNFYFEVITNQKNDSIVRLTQYLASQIAEHKYTITNRSGQEWPYYRVLGRDEEISSDSLMPPHWFVHRMLPMHPGQEIKIDEYLVRFHIFPRPDTLPNYNVEIYNMDSSGLSLSGFSGVHFIDSTEFSPPETLRGFLLKSILRYSFK